jgi:arsenate reductase-like glutaredoxin family protein
MEEFKDLFGEELYNQVVSKIGDKKLILNDGKYIPITKFNEVNESKKALEQQIEHYKKTGLDTEQLLSSNKELNQKFQELQNASKAQLEEYQKNLTNISKKTLVKDILINEKAIYPELLLKEIDFDFIKLDGETLQGFNVADLKQKFPSMFQTQKIEGTKPIEGGNPPTPSSKKQQLIDQYNEASKNKNGILMMKLHAQIKNFKE